MKKVISPLSFAFFSVTLLVFVNLGCSVIGLEPNLETVTSAKPQESIFTVIEMEDLEYPTVAASIRLPFRVRSNNTVALAGKHAYVTTERHLHAIDVSIPRRPCYLTSIAFPDRIGKALVSGHHVVVATPQKLHLVNVSKPSQPVLESTVYLPQRNTIKDLDVLESHLYVMGANDYLYIFFVGRGKAQLVKAVEMSPRWWLLSPKAGGGRSETDSALDFKHFSQRSLGTPPVSTWVFTTPQQQTRESPRIVRFSGSGESEKPNVRSADFRCTQS